MKINWNTFVNEIVRRNHFPIIIFFIINKIGLNFNIFVNKAIKVFLIKIYFSNKIIKSFFK